MSRRFVVLSLSLLMATGGVQAQAGPVTGEDAAAIAEFDKVQTAFHAGNRIPALAVAIVRDGAILWEKAYGWSDDEAEVPATTDTTFSIASVTKPIRAAGTAGRRLSLGLVRAGLARATGWPGIRAGIRSATRRCTSRWSTAS